MNNIYYTFVNGKFDKCDQIEFKREDTRDNLNLDQSRNGTYKDKLINTKKVYFTAQNIHLYLQLIFFHRKLGIVFD